MKKNILFSILAFFIFGILLEFCFSFIFYIKDEKNPLTLSKSVVDFPYVYYSFLPEKKKGNIVINNDGLYSHYNREKPANTIRLLLIGGSTARGMSLSSYEHTIAVILEKLLQKEFPKEKTEVVNAGMSGYVIEQLFIFYQLVLAKYNPDMVVGLNGYNDLMSVKLNRYSGIFFAPQNMQQFKVIEEGKRRKTITGRLSNIFPATFRLVDFLKHKLLGQSQYDYSSFNEAEIKKASSVYINIVKDIHSLCQANNIVYLEFLQPIRWYIKGNYGESIKRGGIPQLIELYKSYDQGLTSLDYGYSLTDLFNTSNTVFKDDCHVSDAGAEMIALRMLGPIKRELEKKLSK